MRLRRVLRRFLQSVLFWCVYSLPAAILFLLRVRFIVLTHPERIGHLCIEPDCYVKERDLGRLDRFFGIFLIPEDTAANRALLGLWAKKLPVVSSRIWCRILRPFTRFAFLVFSVERYAVAFNETAACVGILAKWKGAPVLSQPQTLLIRGRKALLELGVPPGAWFVCVHSREGGYSPSDEYAHSFRNSDISNYQLAMEAIVERGGWCIRVGESTAKLASPMKGVVDYAHSAAKSDWMDVFLCANCRFFLGNSSGLHLLASVFGVPSALANVIPGASSLSVVPGDIAIPKMLQRRESGELLTFTAIMGSEVANFRFAKEYADQGLVLEENTAEDIRDLALEMLECCSGGAAYAPEDEDLQARFKALFRDGHFGFGAASRIGREFLKKYARFI